MLKRPGGCISMRVMLRSGIVCVHCEVKRLEGAERLMMLMVAMRLAQLMK